MIISMSIDGCDQQTSLDSKDHMAELGPKDWTDLVLGDQWELMNIMMDPHRHYQEGREVCLVTDFGVEYGGVELSTRLCDYATLTQGIQNDLKVGDLLEVTLWHSPLISDTPAEGQMIISLGDIDLWSTKLVIPSPAQSWTEVIEISQNIAEGTPILFHVRNHGANTYTLLSVKRGRRMGEEL